MNRARLAYLGEIEDLELKYSKLYSKKIFQKLCKIRFFEEEVKEAHKKKLTTPLVYLSIGQEAVSVGVSFQMKNSYVLAQHRGHGAYLAFNGNPLSLRDELLGLKSGCCGGKGGSPMIHDIKKKIIGHCGLIGDQVPVAIGLSLVKKEKKIVCFFGDGAAEEDYVLAALSYATQNNSQILFICDDNDLSVLTPTKDRRKWKLADVAKSFGLNAVDITDDPWLIDHWTKKLKNSLPALINIRTCRDIWHVGSEKDKSLDWNRFEITKKKLKKIFKENEILEIERTSKLWAKKIWKT